MSNSPGLTASIQESVEYQRESQWTREGVPEALIVLSRQTGMDAADMQVFEAISRSGWLVVVRCPKPEARAWHGVFGPKTGATSAKSGSSGLVVTGSCGAASSFRRVWQEDRLKLDCGLCTPCEHPASEICLVSPVVSGHSEAARPATSPHRRPITLVRRVRAGGSLEAGGGRGRKGERESRFSAAMECSIKAA